MNIELTKAMFENTIVMFVSEPGAMGPNTMEFMNSFGEVQRITYTVGDTYDILREAFPLLKECRWDGPLEEENKETCEVKIGGGLLKTRIPKGWKHLYLGYGNHLAIKDEYYDKAMTILGGHSNIDITFDWDKLLINGEFINSKCY